MRSAATLARIALRQHLVGVIATTVIACLAGVAQVFGFVELAGPTPADRAIFARQMELIGRQLSYMLPLPLELDTLGGYLQWRVYGSVALVYGFWALLGATGAARGDEDRGLVGQWLSAGASRFGYLASRLLVFVVLASLSIAVLSAATLLSAAALGEPLDGGGIARQGIALLALALCCWGIALVVAQLTGTRRAALGYGGALLLGLFFLNSAARSSAGADGPWVVSPFWAYERSAPLLSSGALDIGSVVALLVATAALVLAAALAFASRDAGEPLVRLGRGAGAVTRTPSRDPLLRVPVLSLVRQQAVAIVGWSLGLAGVTAFLISLTRTIVDALLGSPTMRVYFERAGVGGTPGAAAYSSFVGVIWASTVLLLLSLYAIAQVSGWSADDAEGRLETVLAQPVSRPRVAIERLAATLLGGAIIAAASVAAAALTAAAQDIPLDGSRVALAGALFVAVVGAFASIGAVLAGWRPRVAVLVLGAVAMYGYFAQQLAPLFDWPSWVKDSSIYVLYGTPLQGDVSWSGPSVLVGLTIGGALLAVIALQRRDVGT